MNARFTLKKNSDFRRLYSKGKSAATPYMVLYTRRNRGGPTRVGFTVSAKIGNAVTRNRVRRRLREIFRLNSPDIKHGRDIVIVARARSVGADYGKMNQAFLKACEELNLMKEQDET